MPWGPYAYLARVSARVERFWKIEPSRRSCARQRRHGINRSPHGNRFPSSNVLVFTSEDGTRLTVRPSGTEPKIKFYLEMVKHVAERAGLKDARNALGKKCEGIRAQLEKRFF